MTLGQHAVELARGLLLFLRAVGLAYRGGFNLSLISLTVGFGGHHTVRCWLPLGLVTVGFDYPLSLYFPLSLATVC